MMVAIRNPLIFEKNRTLIEMICNTILSFCLMNDRMPFSNPDLFNNFAKCLTMNALAERHIVTQLLQENSTKELLLMGFTSLVGFVASS